MIENRWDTQLWENDGLMLPEAYNELETDLDNTWDIWLSVSVLLHELDTDPLVEKDRFLLVTITNILVFLGSQPVFK